MSMLVVVTDGMGRGRGVFRRRSRLPHSIWVLF